MNGVNIYGRRTAAENDDAPLALEKGEVVNIRQITVQHKNTFIKCCMSVCIYLSSKFALWTRRRYWSVVVENRKGASKRAQSRYFMKRAGVDKRMVAVIYLLSSATPQFSNKQALEALLYLRGVKL
jgi:putative SOS response-associated peptidase YedK